MGDPSDLITIGTHGGVGVGSGVLVAFLTRFFASKESQEVASKLAVIEQQLETLTKTLDAHAELGERVAALEEAIGKRRRRR